ncbi:MAG TPA: hypothetical protein VKE27_10445 [Candidatus Dormibacteraeota bacterium]|nr:hypothetical protein [Candidatus Dormibacteraeota bacterium]
MRQIAVLSFAAGLGIATFVSYFFDRRQGSARRRMAYDKITSAGRRMGRWSGGKARHVRNKAAGTVAEIRPPEGSESIAGSR